MPMFSQVAAIAAALAAPTELPSHVTASLIVEAPDAADVRLAHASVDARAAGDAALVTLTLTTAAASRPNQLAELAISIPRNARVVDMRYGTGDAPLAAIAMASGAAREELAHAANPPSEYPGRDPALLELARTTASYQRLKLSIYPISPEAPAVVTITLALPRFDRLLAAIGDDRVTIPGAELPAATAAERTLAALPASVTTDLALYAAPPLSPPDPAAVAAVFEQVRPALASCAAADGAAAPLEVAIRFAVDANGRTGQLRVGHAGEMLARCVMDVVDYARFAAGSAPAVVHYRLQLTPAPPRPLDMDFAIDQ